MAVLESPAAADWPIVVLQRLLAFNILLAHGRLGEADPPDYGHRIPLGGPIVGSSTLTHILIARPDGYEAQFSLASGKVDLLHAVGITEEERNYAKANGSEALLGLLKSEGRLPVTDPARVSVTA
jgi:hypothetical protein